METKQSSPQVSDSALQLSGNFPELPAEVTARFPEAQTWMDEVRQKWGKSQQAMQEFARAVLDVTQIGNVLDVDGANGSLYIKNGRGAGAYSDPDTPFYVDSKGRFSLKNLLTWDPAAGNLAVQGTIIATAGSIGGWDINATTLSKNNAVLDSGGQLVLGTGNNVIIISATNATYRVWAGDATAGTAAFSVTKAGALFSTAGTIGGFSIGDDYLRDTANSFGLASTVTGGNDVRFWAGETFANRATAPVRIYEDGSATLSGAVTIGTNQRVVISDNSNYLTWQGNAGLNVPGIYLQHETNAGGGVNILALGTNANSAVGLTKARGSFGAITAVGQNDRLGLVFSQAYTGVAWSTMVRNIHGITNSTSTPFFQIDMENSMWVFNYDGKLYFSDVGFWDGPNTAYGAPYVPDSKANIYRSAAGTMKTDGDFVATNLTGAGANVTALSATNISAGTLDTARLPATISITTAYQISGTTVIDGSRNIFPALIHGESGGYTVGLATGSNTLYLKYNGGLDLVVCKVDATDFALVRAQAYSADTTPVYSGFVSMKDSGGTSRKFMVAT